MTHHSLFPHGRSVVLIAVALVAIAASAKADIIVNYQDVGSDLQFNWAGSLDLNGSNSVSTTLARIGAGASIPASAFQYFYGFSGTYSNIQGNSFTRSPSPNTEWIFGNAANFVSSTAGSSISGDSFGMSFTTDNLLTIFLPANYVSGTAISGTMTIPSQSVSSTGLSPASFTLGGGDGVITFQAVPEPAALPLAATAVAAMTGLRRIRRRRLRNGPG